MERRIRDCNAHHCYAQLCKSPDAVIATAFAAPCPANGCPAGLACAATPDAIDAILSLITSLVGDVPLIGPGLSSVVGILTTLLGGVLGGSTGGLGSVLGGVLGGLLSGTGLGGALTPILGDLVTEPVSMPYW